MVCGTFRANSAVIDFHAIIQRDFRTLGNPIDNFQIIPYLTDSTARSCVIKLISRAMVHRGVENTRIHQFKPEIILIAFRAQIFL